MSTPTDQLPQELKDAIEMEANLYEHESQRAVSADEYIRIATTYALRAYRAEQEAERYRKALEGIARIPIPGDPYLLHSWAAHVQGKATKALNPPAGDNNKTEKDGE